MNFFKTYLSALCFIVVLAAGCKKDNPPPPPTAPVVTTAALTNVTSSGATAGGSIVSDGRDTLTQVGIVWSKSNATPTIADSVITVISSNGMFIVDITGLDFNTSYYIRAFATNSIGTGYGEVVTLNTTDDTTKVRFTYNNEEVIYGIIISPTTGRKWLDRNLGAKQAATAFDDYLAYGDIFQWGRPADGHQLINWSSSTDGTPVNEMIHELATSDIPGHNKWIDVTGFGGSTGTSDWRDDNNANRWATNPQGPCPVGWHIPTIDEWAAETTAENPPGTASSGGITNRATAYNELKLTAAGFRRAGGSTVGQFVRIGTDGYYWSTSLEMGTYGFIATTYNFGAGYTQISPNPLSMGACVRCIKD